MRAHRHIVALPPRVRIQSATEQSKAFMGYLCTFIAKLTNPSALFQSSSFGSVRCFRIAILRFESFVCARRSVWLNKNFSSVLVGANGSTQARAIFFIRALRSVDQSVGWSVFSTSFVSLWPRTVWAVVDAAVIIMLLIYRSVNFRVC